MKMFLLSVLACGAWVSVALGEPMPPAGSSDGAPRGATHAVAELTEAARGPVVLSGAEMDKVTAGGGHGTVTQWLIPIDDMGTYRLMVCRAKCKIE